MRMYDNITGKLLTNIKMDNKGTHVAGYSCSNQLYSADDKLLHIFRQMHNILSSEQPCCVKLQKMVQQIAIQQFKID